MLSIQTFNTHFLSRRHHKGKLGMLLQGRLHAYISYDHDTPHSRHIPHLLHFLPVCNQLQYLVHSTIWHACSMCPRKSAYAFSIGNLVPAIPQSFYRCSISYECWCNLIWSDTMHIRWWRDFIHHLCFSNYFTHPPSLPPHPFLIHFDPPTTNFNSITYAHH